MWYIYFFVQQQNLPNYDFTIILIKSATSKDVLFHDTNMEYVTYQESQYNRELCPRYALHCVLLCYANGATTVNMGIEIVI